MHEQQRLDEFANRILSFFARSDSGVLFHRLMQGDEIGVESDYDPRIPCGEVQLI